MTWVLLLFGLLLSLGMGAMVVGLCWPRTGPDGPRGPDRILRLSLAAGLGLALNSGVAYAWLNLPGHARPLLIGLDLTLLAVLAAGRLLMRRQKFGAENQPGSTAADAPGLASPPPRLVYLERLGLAAAFAAAGIIAWQLLLSPHGAWDAWGIWNLRARFLFRAGSDWHTTFDPALSPTHLDYPLLLPLSVARLWTYLGTDSTVAPRVLALLFALLVIGTLYGSLTTLKGRGQASLGVLALLATPEFVSQSALQYADVPTAFFLLAAVTLVVLASRCGEVSGGGGSDGGRPRIDARPTTADLGLLVLAGLAAGAAAWTKNEGRLMVAVAAAAIVAVGLFSGGLRPTARQLGCFLLGLAPLILLLLVKDRQFAFTNDLVPDKLSDLRWAIQLRATQWPRHLTILSYVARNILFNPPYLIVWGLPACALALGGRPDRRLRTGVVAGGLTVALTAAGYYVIYLITPHDLPWHLETSAPRLFVQLWPSIILLTLLSSATPEEAWGRGATDLAAANPSGGTSASPER